MVELCTFACKNLVCTSRSPFPSLSVFVSLLKNRPLLLFQETMTQYHESTRATLTDCVSLWTHLLHIHTNIQRQEHHAIRSSGMCGALHWILYVLSPILFVLLIIIVSLKIRHCKFIMLQLSSLVKWFFNQISIVHDNIS